MRKSFLQIVALLLLPCLMADQSVDFGLAVQRPHDNVACHFNDQALAARTFSQLSRALRPLPVAVMMTIFVIAFTSLSANLRAQMVVGPSGQMTMPPPGFRGYPGGPIYHPSELTVKPDPKAPTVRVEVRRERFSPGPKDFYRAKDVFGNVYASFIVFKTPKNLRNTDIIIHFKERVGRQAAVLVTLTPNSPKVDFNKPEGLVMDPNTPSSERPEPFIFGVKEDHTITIDTRLLDPKKLPQVIRLGGHSGSSDWGYSVDSNGTEAEIDYAELVYYKMVPIALAPKPAPPAPKAPVIGFHSGSDGGYVMNGDNIEHILVDADASKRILDAPSLTVKLTPDQFVFRDHFKTLRLIVEGPNDGIAYEVRGKENGDQTWTFTRTGSTAPNPVQYSLGKDRALSITIPTSEMKVAVVAQW